MYKESLQYIGKSIDNCSIHSNHALQKWFQCPQTWHSSAGLVNQQISLWGHYDSNFCCQIFYSIIQKQIQ